MFIPTKTQLACQWSVERLFEVDPRVYFWTFTWTKKYHDSFYGRSWSMFWDNLKWNFKEHIRGVRVFEPHKRGGLHCHLVCNQRIPVSLVRRIGKYYGVGRVQVRRAVLSDALYVAKYLSKDRCAKGVRGWARVGCFRGSQVRNIVNESPQAVAIRVALRNLPRPKTKGGRYIQYQCVLADVRQHAFNDTIDEYILSLTTDREAIPLPQDKPLTTDPF